MWNSKFLSHSSFDLKPEQFRSVVKTNEFAVSFESFQKGLYYIIYKGTYCKSVSCQESIPAKLPAALCSSLALCGTSSSLLTHQCPHSFCSILNVSFGPSLDWFCGQLPPVQRSVPWRRGQITCHLAIEVALHSQRRGATRGSPSPAWILSACGMGWNDHVERLETYRHYLYW